MASWYRHDIAAWMDGTEELDCESYRVYHVVCQLIYLNEGPIRLNEAGIAGRCKMHILKFRTRLAGLVHSGKLSFEDGRIGNPRATEELKRLPTRRRPKADPSPTLALPPPDPSATPEEQGGGSMGGKLRNPLKNGEASSELPLLDKTRLDVTRPEKKDGAPAPVDPPDKAFFQRSRQVLGPKAGGSMGAKILKACDGNISRATVLIENASQKDSPIEYISKTLHNLHNPEQGLHPRF